MKLSVLAVSAFLAIAAKGQGPRLITVPADTLTVRMQLASMQLGKAAFCRNTSLWWGLFGSAFTALAMDRSVKVYDERLAIGLGTVTAAGFFSFQLAGAIHDRRASKALIGQ